MDITVGNEQLLQVLNACQFPLMWLAITAIVLLVAGFLYIHKKNCAKDIHNVDKWSEATNNAIVLNISSDPEVAKENFAKLQQFANDVANYIGRKEADDILSLKILERLDELKEMQRK